MLLSLFFIFLVIAEVILPPGFVDQLLTVLTPVISAIALWAIIKLKAVQGVTGFIINLAFVPLCSALATLIVSLISTPTVTIVEQLLYGLASAWIAQLMIQWNQRKVDKAAGGFVAASVTAAAHVEKDKALGK